MLIKELDFAQVLVEAEDSSVVSKGNTTNRKTILADVSIDISYQRN